MDDIKVSVIIPVYNVEKYIAKCLDSLVSQTLQDIEIIVVNDGSTDKSQEVIDDFESRYPDKIIIIEKENEGPGAARNLAVAHSRGRYIGFVDADDWAQPEMYKTLYDAANAGDYDCVICDYFKMDETSGECNPINLWHEDKAKLGSVSGFVQLSTNPAMAWNKIYRRELVLNTPFPPTAYFEDVATIPIILSNCESIHFIPIPLYTYLKRPGSITSQRNNPRNRTVLEAWDRLLTETNPVYMREMEYAVYVSISYFLLARREHLDDFYMFFWKNEERFKNNRFILKETLEDTLVDLFGLMEKAGVPGDMSNPLTQNMLEFMADTLPLVEQLDKLPYDTLKELADMYNIAVQTATENIDVTGLKLLVQLCARQERIGQYIEIYN